MQDGDFRQDWARIGRRGMLGLMGAAVLAPAARAADCVALPGEANGPYPGDGTNAFQGSTVNVLTEAGILRSDIRPSFGGMTPVADGIPLTLTITLAAAGSCAPLAGRAIYVWHCDAAGRYSIYGVTDANYLRGLQISDDQGRVTFTTILPGTYPGRYPHVHVEVFDTPADAVDGRKSRLIAQIALPDAVLAPLYAADPRYAASVPALAAMTLADDMVFGDNSAAEQAQQMLALAGDGAGLSGQVTVPL